jgi:hypothetical protein
MPAQGRGSRPSPVTARLFLRPRPVHVGIFGKYFVQVIFQSVPPILSYFSYLRQSEIKTNPTVISFTGALAFCQSLFKRHLHSTTDRILME